MGKDKLEEPAAEEFIVPDMPIAMATALREGVEYVDATALLKETLEHAANLHKLLHIVANSLAVTQRSVLRLHREAIENRADLNDLQNGQPGSKLILPDHMRN